MFLKLFDGTEMFFLGLERKLVSFNSKTRGAPATVISECFWAFLRRQSRTQCLRSQETLLYDNER